MINRYLYETGYLKRVLRGGGQWIENWDAIFLGIREGCNRVLWTEGIKEMSFKTYLKEKVALGPKL